MSWSSCQVNKYDVKATKRNKLTNKETAPNILIVRSSLTTSDTTTSASLSGFKFGELTFGVDLLLSVFAMMTNIKRNWLHIYFIQPNHPSPTSPAQHETKSPNWGNWPKYKRPAWVDHR